jgi:hypothetical protein
MSYIEPGGVMENVPNDVPARIDSLENRVRHLEVITGEIRTKVDSMADNMATKADIAMLMAEMAQQKAYVSHRLEQHLRLVLVTLAGTFIAGITIMTFVLNYAAPPRTPALQPAAQPQPIIITVPERR